MVWIKKQEVFSGILPRSGKFWYFRAVIKIINKCQDYIR